MHHQPTTQTTLFHLLLPALHPTLYPPTASVILLPPLDTPQHHPSQPSRILVPHSSLFIHPSCTPPLPSPPTNHPTTPTTLLPPPSRHRHRARSPAAATTAADATTTTTTTHHHHHRHHHALSFSLSFCILHRADTPGVLNGIVATLLLATSKCRRRRLRLHLRRRRKQRTATSLALMSPSRLSLPTSTFLPTVLRFRVKRHRGKAILLTKSDITDDLSA